MLKIKVFVNNREIDEVCIWNISAKYGVGIQKYKVFDAKMKRLFDIDHKYEHGYWKLIQKVVSKLKDKPKKKGEIEFEKLLFKFLHQDILKK